MGILFGPKKLYSAKQMKWSKAKNSGVMKDILKDKDVARALDKSSERNEFYSALQSRASDGISARDMQEVLGHFMQGKGRAISKKEARAMTQGIMKGYGKKYTYKNTDVSMEKNFGNKIDPASHYPEEGRVYGQNASKNLKGQVYSQKPVSDSSSSLTPGVSSVRVVPIKTGMSKISPNVIRKTSF